MPTACFVVFMTCRGSKCYPVLIYSTYEICTYVLAVDLGFCMRAVAAHMIP